MKISLEGILEFCNVLCNLRICHSRLFTLLNLIVKNIVRAFVPTPSVAVLLSIILRSLLSRELRNVLLVYGAVFVEEDGIHLRTLQLIKETVLHIILMTEVELLKVSGAVLKEREILLNRNALVHPGNKTVTVVSVAGEGYYIVQNLRVFLSRHSLIKEARNSLVLISAKHLRILDSAGVVSWIEVLSAIRLKVVVEEIRIYRISCNELKLKVQVIIETVRTN